MNAQRDKASPWWRFPMVWLVIAGPVLVIFAGFWTLKLALSIPDPVLTVQSEGPGNTRSLAEQPAVQARNHAVTGQVPAGPRP